MSTSNYTQIAQGISNVLGGLALSGVQTLLYKFPTDRAAGDIAIPVQQVTIGPAAERAAGILSGANDWEYPFLLSFMQPCNQDLGWDSSWLSWRRQVQGALHGKRPLTSLSTNPLLTVDPSVVADPGFLHDGNLKIGQLLVWARQRETRTIAPATAGQPGGNAIYASVGSAVQAVIQAIGLAGIANAQVILLSAWADRAAINVNLASGPAIVISVDRTPEREVGPTTGKDDYYWPALVTILRASNQNLTWDDSWFLMRQQIRDAFHYQVLYAIGTSLWCEVEPRVILDPALWHEQNIDMGQLLIRCRTREPRS